MPTARRALALLTSLIAPPRCGICGESCSVDDALCGACSADLAGHSGRFLSVPAVDVAWAACDYEGTPQRLITALKFSGRLALAGAAAEAIVESSPAGLAAGAVVPVPPAPGRRRARGFDPTALIAESLVLALRLQYTPCLTRTDGPRQVGRPRRVRLANPPHVSALGSAPPTVTLIDDVVTTGATLAACALALRAAGAQRVTALAFARTRDLADRPVWGLACKERLAQHPSTERRSGADRGER